MMARDPVLISLALRIWSLRCPGTGFCASGSDRPGSPPCRVTFCMRAGLFEQKQYLPPFPRNASKLHFRSNPAVQESVCEKPLQRPQSQQSVTLEESIAMLPPLVGCLVTSSPTAESSRCLTAVRL